jgi:hypothetical protein
MCAQADGTVLACGGQPTVGDYSYTCALYNAVYNNWTDMRAWYLQVAIARMAMLTLNEVPFVFGGDTGVTLENRVFMLNSGVWIVQTTVMPVALHSHTAVAIADNVAQSALVCGGVRVDTSVTDACNMYSHANTATPWTQAASLNTARGGHGMAMYKGE